MNPSGPNRESSPGMVADERSTGMPQQFAINIAICNMEKKCREVEERKTRLESMLQRKEELDKLIKEKLELFSSYEMFLKEEEADQAAERAERVRQESIGMDAELDRLKTEKAERHERKREMQHQIQRYSRYNDLLAKAVKKTEFKDVDEFVNHFQNILHVRDQLLKKEINAQELIDQQRKTLRTLQQEHKLMLLEKNNQLSQLQTKLDTTRSEALIWEEKWNHIQQTATKKILKLGKIKMATLNLYEMSCGKEEEAAAVDVNDTEKQLDQIMTFMKDYTNIVKEFQRSQISMDERKQYKAKITQAKKTKD